MRLEERHRAGWGLAADMYSPRCGNPRHFTLMLTWSHTSTGHTDPHTSAWSHKSYSHIHICMLTQVMHTCTHTHTHPAHSPKSCSHKLCNT